jgi:hypothetical protein
LFFLSYIHKNNYILASLTIFKIDEGREIEGWKVFFGRRRGKKKLF